MTCADIHEQIVLAVYGELPDDQAHATRLHLAGCAECREEQEQLLALKTLAAANPVLDPSPNLVARSRARLEDQLDALPPKRWYDRLADWMTRTATGLQSAPVAAVLLLVAGAGLGSMGGYEFAQRHAGAPAMTAGTPNSGAKTDAGGVSTGEPGSAVAGSMAVSPNEIASISGVTRVPNSNLVDVSFNQVEPRRMKGTLDDPQIRQLLMLASQNASNAGVRDDSVALLSAACRSGHGCAGNGVQSMDFRDALRVSLRYDRSATVRLKALEGLQPYVGEDMQVRDAVLEALENDPDARVRSAAISMLEPVEADTSVRQVLSTVALSDQNSNVRTASRVVLRRVSTIQ
jgi:hypothetical protein